MDKKIPLVVFISITISFTIVYFVNDFYRTNSDMDKWENLFYNQEFNLDKEKLFLIGSSFTVRINQTEIERVLQENGHEIDVYNLGKPRDYPADRLKTLDMIIKSKPDYVVYTIGYRDLDPVDKISEDDILQVKSVGQFTKINIFSNETSSFDKFNLGIDFDNFENPKFTTLSLIDQSLKKKRDPPIVENTKHPFQYQGPLPIMTLKEMEDKYKKMKYRNDVQLEGENGKALDQIVSKLTSNNIKVFLHLSPYHEWYLVVIPDEEEQKFYSYTNQLSKKYGVKIIDNQRKYSDLEIWNDYRHIAFHTDSKIYFNDIAKGILGGLED